MLPRVFLEEGQGMRGVEEGRRRRGQVGVVWRRESGGGTPGESGASCC